MANNIRVKYTAQRPRNQYMLFRNAAIAAEAGDKFTLPMDYKEDFSALVKTEDGPRLVRCRIDKALDIPVLGECTLKPWLIVSSSEAGDEEYQAVRLLKGDDGKSVWLAQYHRGPINDVFENFRSSLSYAGQMKFESLAELYKSGERVSDFTRMITGNFKTMVEEIGRSYSLYMTGFDEGCIVEPISEPRVRMVPYTESESFLTIRLALDIGESNNRWVDLINSFPLELSHSFSLVRAELCRTDAGTTHLDDFIYSKFGQPLNADKPESDRDYQSETETRLMKGITKLISLIRRELGDDISPDAVTDGDTETSLRECRMLLHRLPDGGAQFLKSNGWAIHISPPDFAEEVLDRIMAVDFLAEKTLKTPERKKIGPR